MEKDKYLIIDGLRIEIKLNKKYFVISVYRKNKYDSLLCTYNAQFYSIDEAIDDFKIKEEEYKKETIDE